MQDFPYELPARARVGFTTVNQARARAPALTPTPCPQTLHDTPRWKQPCRVAQGQVLAYESGA